MTNKLQDLIDAQNTQNFATAAGRRMHTKMQSVYFMPSGPTGEPEIIKQVSMIPELVEIMGPLSKTEVPIAGFANGIFISRRIDRLYINKNTKKIIILDYKTDTNKNLFKQKYIEQLNEYRQLLKQIYTDFTIDIKILWLHDFTLENIA